ncbi:putative Mg2+ transporter-C (MgtC) family protein [Streptomyces sp. 2131.1]|uniref:MgtC/SapB family protein n=1 Tax=Streptomyces sp. 2131.1 TaxID=1855346 RepID=UPI00089C6C0C|nr:MgtC/SapB family protein [Streptomyces sp. 2131.1]SEE50147.1 putative Mg2+ transporter-C (MgtC) family protein [Streptomyces sp. 2131.1]
MNHDGTSLAHLAVAFALCAVIGLEREYRQKSAGLRTHVLVGLGSALFMLVSKYGFADMLGLPGVALDPSRVAAQIVSGIGFIGGGLIFVRRDAVRGLTTAASVWLAASIGAAAGAGLLLLAAAVTAAYLLVTFAFPVIARQLPRSPTESVLLRVSYLDGRGLLRDIVRECTGAGFHVAGLRTAGCPAAEAAPAQVGVLLELSGNGVYDELVPRLSDREGITEVTLLQDEVD